MRRRKTGNNVDYMLLATIIALLAFGLLMLYSATFYVGTDFWSRQVLWVAIGLVVMFVFYWVPYSIWRLLALPIMAITLVLLFMVLFFGEQVWGAQRALLGPSVQPGVLARLVAVIYIAAWLASKGEQLNKVNYGLVPFAIIIGIVAGLVALQPDLSTALLIASTGITMFFFAGGDPIQIFATLVLGSVGFFMVALQFAHAAQRLTDFIATIKDPSKMPYHVHSAVLAISEGGITGAGIGSGRLKFGYLPFPHTDSIFAVIAEEVGLMGVVLLIGLFVFLAYRGFRVTLETPDPFGSLLAFGVTIMISSEALLNILVMTGLIPFTGTALPFFSYGGTEMMVTMAGMGLMLGVSCGRPRSNWDEVLVRWGRNGWARISSAFRRRGLVNPRA
jgi:cell division protein FtsW